MGRDIMQERVKSGEGERRVSTCSQLCLSTDHCPGQSHEAGPLLEGRCRACGQVGVGSQHAVGGTGPIMRRPLPDKPILSSTPERVGPHGRRGDALHPVCVVSKHVDRLLHRQVVDVHLGVGCPRDQDPVPSMRQELLQRD